jgi:hypothetical protein
VTDDTDYHELQWSPRSIGVGVADRYFSVFYAIAVSGVEGITQYLVRAQPQTVYGFSKAKNISN